MASIFFPTIIPHWIFIFPKFACVNPFIIYFYFIFRKPINELFSEFEGKDFEDESIDGDVKYHLGFTTYKTLRNNKKLKMNLVPNPSHLETVGAVVQGITRAKQDKDEITDASQVLPIVVHGDAAIAGQGLVYEVVQMAQLDGYKTNGTIHIVVNNQIGITTNYLDGRSSTYCTDVAKVTLSPVLHGLPVFPKLSTPSLDIWQTRHQD